MWVHYQLIAQAGDFNLSFARQFAPLALRAPAVKPAHNNANKNPEKYQQPHRHIQRIGRVCFIERIERQRHPVAIGDCKKHHNDDNGRANDPAQQAAQGLAFAVQPQAQLFAGFEKWHTLFGNFNAGPSAWVAARAGAALFN